REAVRRLILEEEHRRVLLCRVDDRALRRCIEAIPDGDPLSHAVKVESARLRIDEPIEDDRSISGRVEDGRPGPDRPAGAAWLLGAGIAAMRFVELLLLVG